MLNAGAPAIDGFYAASVPCRASATRGPSPRGFSGQTAHFSRRSIGMDDARLSVPRGGRAVPISVVQGCRWSAGRHRSEASTSMANLTAEDPAIHADGHAAEID